MSCIWKNNALKNNSLASPNHKSDSHKHTWCRLMSVHSQIIRLFHWKNITGMWCNASVHLINFYPTFWLQEQLYITELLYRSFFNLMKDIDLISKNKCFVIFWLSFTEVFSSFPSVVVMLAFEWGTTQTTKINKWISLNYIDVIFHTLKTYYATKMFTRSRSAVQAESSNSFSHLAKGFAQSIGGVKICSKCRNSTTRSTYPQKSRSL